jgi:hypothetical protein
MAPGHSHSNDQYASKEHARCAEGEEDECHNRPHPRERGRGGWSLTCPAWGAPYSSAPTPPLNNIINGGEC